MQFQSIRFDRAALTEYSALFSACFPGTNRFTVDYLSWLYVDNPDGLALGFDALADGVLAAHYVCIPVLARINGQQVRVLLSLNTATHPNFQGRGLFTKLASMTYDAAANAGYEGIYGVANANSTPGFIRKLSFQLVRQLDALIGIGSASPMPRAVSSSLAFERVWNANTLDWRCSSPFNPVMRRRYGHTWQFYASAVGPWLNAYAAIALDEETLLTSGDVPFSPLKLYLGLMPDDVRKLRGYIEIPQRLRPSPLNLIYRSLVNPGEQLDPARISFSFLDFDAY